MKLNHVVCSFMLVFYPMVAITEQKPLKVLHLSFHQGCIREITYIAEALGLDLTSIFVQRDWMPTNDFDGKTKGNAIYNVNHERAHDAWLHHQDFFNQFDIIMTSDTAPLSRIFLQNNWEKPLITWICNRFDYVDLGTRDKSFPDREYYDLFAQAANRKNVHIISYTAFEHTYARADKHIEIGTRTIKPSGMFKNDLSHSLIPAHIKKEETFFIPPYDNDRSLGVEEQCRKLGIPCYHGRYNGPADLEQFKGIIHIPYSWSNLALFENMQLGIPYFIPTKEFLLDNLKKRRIWWPDGNYMFTYAHLAEWYDTANKDCFIYFDSWKDLKQKIEKTNYNVVRARIRAFGKKHQEKTLKQWKDLFDTISQEIQ
jgi:hypothetical protein